MTLNEALRVFKHIPFNDMFNHFSNRKNPLEKVDEGEKDFNFNFIIDYLMSLTISPEEAIKFFDYDIEFATIDNKPTHDDVDYYEVDEDGIWAWTEVLGNIYYLHEMNVTWKEYEPSAEELEARRKAEEERSKYWKEEIDKTWSEVINNTIAMIDKDLVTVAPIRPMKYEGLGEYKKEK